MARNLYVGRARRLTRAGAGLGNLEEYLMRFVFGKVAALAVASVLATAAVVGCSSNNTDPQAENLGSVGMHLKMGPGVTVDAVTLTVTDPLHMAPAAPVMVRTIPSPGDGADFNFAVSLPPTDTTTHAGQPYHAHLEAHSVVTATMRHSVTCLGDADFTVAAGTTATASITLVCDDDLVNGDQKFNVTVDSRVCPLYVDYASTSPTTVQANGGVATLSGTAHDETANPETSGFTYQWSAPAGSGTIAQPSTLSGNATFTCGNPNNNVVLTLTATRLDQGCSDSISVWVNCASANCGNGTKDSGETCDDGNTIDTDSCPADCTFACGDGKIEGDEQCDPPGDAAHCGTLNGKACQRLPYCGDQVVNGTEQCDDGNQTNTDSCTNTCQNAKCGDGFKQGTEQCDDGNTVDTGDSCQNNCTLPIGPAVCGDGVTQSPETCDPAVTGKCFSTCQLETTAACTACETANAASFAQEVTNCDTLTGSLTPLANNSHGQNLYTNSTLSSVCSKVLECVRKTNCANINTTDCICGIGADPTQCFNGVYAIPEQLDGDGNVTNANTAGDLQGPCIAEIAGGLQLKKNNIAGLFSNLTLVSFPGGAVMSRITVERGKCAGGTGPGTPANAGCFTAPSPAVP